MIELILTLTLILIFFYYLLYKRMIKRIENELEKKIDLSKLLYEKQLPIKMNK